MRALRLQEIKEAQAAKQPAQSLIPLVDFSNLKKHLEVKGEGHAVICMCRRLSYYYCYAHTPIHLYLAEVYTGGGGRGSHVSTHPRSISRGRRMALFSSSSLPSVGFVIHLLLRCILLLNGFLHHTHLFQLPLAYTMQLCSLQVRCLAGNLRRPGQSSMLLLLLLLVWGECSKINHSKSAHRYFG